MRNLLISLCSYKIYSFYYIFLNQSITFSQINKPQHSSSGDAGINHLKGFSKALGPLRVTTFKPENRKGNLYFKAIQATRHNKQCCVGRPDKIHVKCFAFFRLTQPNDNVHDSIMVFRVETLRLAWNKTWESNDSRYAGHHKKHSI